MQSRTIPLLWMKGGSMETFTVGFCYVSNEARKRVSLTDEHGREITLKVDAETKTAAIYHKDVVAFCEAQGNDMRVRSVTR